MLSGFDVYNPNMRPVGVYQIFLIRQMAINSANRFLSDSLSAARSSVLEDSGAIIFLSMINCMSSRR